VIGVDTSPAMLERAREKVPGGTFHEADVHDVPIRDDSVDLVVCAIALTTSRTSSRRSRNSSASSGRRVISDSRGLIGDIGLPLVRIGPDGAFGYMPGYARLASDYLAAASRSASRCAGAWSH
jgi:SAM-dependent methyltransferase